MPGEPWNGMTLRSGVSSVSSQSMHPSPSSCLVHYIMVLQLCLGSDPSTKSQDSYSIWCPWPSLSLSCPLALSFTCTTSLWLLQDYWLQLVSWSLAFSSLKVIWLLLLEFLVHQGIQSLTFTGDWNCILESAALLISRPSSTVASASGSGKSLSSGLGKQIMSWNQQIMPKDSSTGLWPVVLSCKLCTWQSSITGKMDTWVLLTSRWTSLAFTSDGDALLGSQPSIHCPVFIWSNIVLFNHLALVPFYSWLHLDFWWSSWTMRLTDRDSCSDRLQESVAFGANNPKPFMLFMWTMKATPNKVSSWHPVSGDLLVTLTTSLNWELLFLGLFLLSHHLWFHTFTSGSFWFSWFTDRFEMMTNARASMASIGKSIATKSPTECYPMFIKTRMSF